MVTRPWWGPSMATPISRKACRVARLSSPSRKPFTSVTPGQGAEHDGTVGDRFVAGHANAAGHAAAGTHPIAQLALLLHLIFRLIAGLVEQGFEVVARVAGAVEGGQHGVAVTALHGAAQPREARFEVVQGRQHRLAVGDEDIAPHHRVAAGDAGEVTKKSVV